MKTNIKKERQKCKKRGNKVTGKYFMNRITKEKREEEGKSEAELSKNKE